MVGTITDEASLSLLDHQQIVETITTSLQTIDNEEQQAKVMHSYTWTKFRYHNKYIYVYLFTLNSLGTVVVVIVVGFISAHAISTYHH